MELKESGNLLRNTIDNSLDMIQVFKAVRNEQNEIVDFIWILNNKASEKVYGEVIGQSLLNLNPGVVEEGIFDTFKKVVETGEPDQSVRHYVHEQFDGWFLQSAVKQDDGVATTTKDITEIKQAQEQIDIAKENLQATLDSSVFVIQAFKAVRNEAGRIIDFVWTLTNDRWNQQYGEMVGKSLLAENPGVVETGLFHKFVQVTETGITIDHEQYYSHEQFHKQWFHQTLVKMGDGFVMNTEDITERKLAHEEILRLKDEIARHAEEKYLYLFNSVDQGFCIIEVLFDETGQPADYRLLEANPVFVGQTGLENAIGKTMKELAPDHEKFWFDTYGEIAKTGRPKRFEHEASQLMGGVWYDVNAFPVGETGQNRVAVLFNNITERKRREELQEYIVTLNDALRPIFDPVEVQQVAMRVLGERLQVDRVVYSEINVDEDYFEIIDNYATESVQKITGRYPYPAFGAGSEKNKNGETLIIQDVSAAVFDDKEKEQFFAMNVHAVVAVPLIKNGKLVMNLSVHQTAPRKWKENEIAIIQDTAERTWMAVERAKTAEALKKSEEQFRRAIEDAPIPVIMYAEDGQVLQLSRSWTELTGFSLADISNFDLWLSTAYGEGADHVRSHMRSLFEGKKRTVNVDFPVTTPNGNLRHWSFSASSPGTLKDGRRFIVGMAVDITDRIKHEEHLKNFSLLLEQQIKERTQELQESRDQLRSILDTTLVQMSILEAVRDGQDQINDLKIVAVNRELEKETGRQDLVGKLYAQEYPGIKQTGLFDMIVEAIETGEPGSTEYFYPHDGFQKWFSCMFVKFGDGVVATNMDISARKHAEEERFKNYVLLQQSEDVALLGSWDFDRLTKSFIWSDGMYRLFGLETGRAVQPEIYVMYATEKSRTTAERVVYLTYHGDADFEETLEISVLGEIKIIRLKAVIVRDSNGQPERVLGVDMDVSAIYTAEDKIRKMEQEQQLEIFKTSLTTLEEERYRISESLHNGIGQILYGIKIHMSNLKPDRSAETFGPAKAYVNKLLTDAIVETRRISHQLMPTTLEQFGLKSAIDDICSQLTDETKFKCHISGLQNRLEKYMELAVYRTTQELMTNVVKHARASECEVKIIVGNDNVKISVSDNGRGMTDSGAGNGIGLASIRSKVKLLDGQVNVSSVPDNGTCIEVVIPHQGFVNK